MSRSVCIVLIGFLTNRALRLMVLRAVMCSRGVMGIVGGLLRSQPCVRWKGSWIVSAWREMRSVAFMGLCFIAMGSGLVLWWLSLIHISEPTRLGMISYAVFC